MGDDAVRPRPWWQDILLPASDHEIAVQGVVLLVLSTAAIAGTWRWVSARLVVIGTVLILAGLFGLRAAH